MGIIIVKVDDRYGLWSTGCDAPASRLGTREELKALLRADALSDFEREFEERMERVESKGTSSRLHDSAKDVMSFNRWGPKEGRLPVKEVVKKWKSVGE